MGGRFITITLLVVLTLACCNFETSEAMLSDSDYKMIKKVNKGGPYCGLLVSKYSELEPFMKSPSFHLNSKISHVVLSGRRFYIGHIGERKMIVAMTGMGMMNAATTTQILCTFFKIKHILHYGLASNADTKLNMGDIVIPQYWAHTGFWNWQKYGYGPDDELAFEEEGCFTRDYGYLKFADYYSNETGVKDQDYAHDNNYLNNIWYQPEEIFHAGGFYPEETKDSIFWIPTPFKFVELAKKLEVVTLDGCTKEGTVCLEKTPKVVAVQRGSSASMYIDNYAYKNFLYSKFHVSSCDMEGAAIALVCHQHYIPFLGFKALYDECVAPTPAQPPSSPPSSSPPLPHISPPDSPSPDSPPHDSPSPSPPPSHSSSSSRSLSPSFFSSFPSPFSSPSLSHITEDKSSIYDLLIDNCIKVTTEFVTKHSHHMSDDHVSVSSS
ncbi:hypothetical protein MKW94_005258 [Papaver nudicaule]|uniref:Nucleoside phosphorylase domain-containing protein n=1 Tax=Papaver nudicaule TaxID=74823 RepID=A0AA41SK29_PAPNU|nr:hypothetical protein [Papaver nudicaule]